MSWKGVRIGSPFGLLILIAFISSVKCYAEVKTQEKGLIINVINVSKEKQRWERIQNEFNQVDHIPLYSSFAADGDATDDASSDSSKNVATPVTFQRFEAVNGKELTKDELRKNTSLGGRLFCPKGTIGCYLSHRKLWEQIYNGNHQYQVVLEDDVTFVDTTFVTDTISRINELERTVGIDSWDVLLLGGLGCINPNRKYGIYNLAAFVLGGCRTPRTISKHIHIPKRAFGGHAYVLSQRGAKKLLQKAWKATYHVDAVAWGIQELDLFICDPLLAYQDSSPSTIGSVTSGIETWMIPKSIKIDQYTKTRLEWTWNEGICHIPFTSILITNGRYLMAGMVGAIIGIIKFLFGHGKYSTWILPSFLTLHITSLFAFGRLINRPMAREDSTTAA